MEWRDRNELFGQSNTSNTSISPISLVYFLISSFVKFLIYSYTLIKISGIQQSELAMHVYVCTLLQTISPIEIHTVQGNVPCAIQYILTNHLFCRELCVHISLNLPISLSTPLPPGNHKFYFHTCDSISVLQISSFVPFFRYHIQAISYDVCLISFFLLCSHPVMSDFL